MRRAACQRQQSKLLKLQARPDAAVLAFFFSAAGKADQPSAQPDTQHFWAGEADAPQTRPSNEELSGGDGSLPDVPAAPPLEHAAEAAQTAGKSPGPLSCSEAASEPA